MVSGTKNYRRGTSISKEAISSENQWTYENEENGKNHERGKEQVNSVAHGREHLRGESCDEEGKEPIGSGDECLGGDSDVGGENFGTKDPWLKIGLSV